MKKEIVPTESYLPKKIVKPEDVVILSNRVAMTGEEILKEMDKQGFRPLTIEEAYDLYQAVKAREPRVIEPRDTDIVIEKTPEKKSTKLLPEK